MAKIYFETLKSAYNLERHANIGGYINLAALQQLCNPKRTTGQGWTFIGSTQDWKRCIQPYYNR